MRPEAGDPVPVLNPTRARWPVYAERPRRRAQQFLADVAVLTWVAVVVSIAILLYDAVLTLQGPGRQLGAAGVQVRDTFGGAADTASGVPFVGDDLARALSNGTQAGEGLVAAGDQEIAAIEALASGLSWTVALLAIVPVVVAWAWLRVRWMLSARAVLLLRDGLRGGEADADLLALRALAHASPRRLTRSVPGAASGWRQGDPHVLARLADLELSRLGLGSPTLVRGPVMPRTVDGNGDIGDDPDSTARRSPGHLPGATPTNGGVTHPLHRVRPGDTRPSLGPRSASHRAGRAQWTRWWTVHDWPHCGRVSWDGRPGSTSPGVVAAAWTR